MYSDEQILKIESKEFLYSNHKLYKTIYNQALEDFVKELKDESSEEWKQFDNWYEFADHIKNKLMK